MEVDLDHADQDNAWGPFDEYGFYDAELHDNIAFTDKLVKDHWKDIQAASNYFDVDPLYIASIISMEARDQKDYYLYGSYFGDKVTLAEVVGAERSSSETKKRIVKVLDFLNENKNIVKYFLPERISEEVVDYVGALFGENTSVGLGQVNVETAKRFGLLELGGRVFKPEIPNVLAATILSDPRLNLFAVAGYTRKLIDEYQRMQEDGINLYLPDVKWNNPSRSAAKQRVTDPVFGTSFAKVFFGGLYTAIDYPEFNLDADIYMTRLQLRFPPETATLIGGNGVSKWGVFVAGYYKYYRENQEKLGLVE